jgi:hypothetical protein
MSRPYRANSFLVLFSGRCPELVCLAPSGQGQQSRHSFSVPEKSY